MSLLKLLANTAGSGTVTIEAPNTNSTFSLTLPSSAGTLISNSGAQTIEFGTGSNTAPSITTTGDTNTGLYFPAADTAAITTGGTERMRINSSGQLLINTTTARSPATYTAPKLQIEATSYTQAGVSIVNNQNSNDQSFIVLGKSRGTTVGSVTAVQNNDTLGDFSFNGADGTGLIAAARIFAEVDGTPGTNDMPGRLIFGTTADGAAAPTERMRINADGTIKTSSTISVGGATPSTSGCGITFPNTENLSTNGNTLDDYEEGVYTVTLTPTTSGSITLNSSYDAIAYTKIGRLVTITGRIRVSSVSSPVGSVNMSLPFSSASISEEAGYSAGKLTIEAATSNANAFFINVTGGSTAGIWLDKTTSWDTATAGEFSGNELLWFSLSYMTT